MIIKRLFLSMISSVALFAQSGGQPINVLVQNPSFEQPPIKPFTQDPCGPWTGETPGWTITPLVVGAGAGIFQPANPSPVDNPNCLGGISPAPDGITVAYLAGASISQDLGVVSGTGIYTMKFLVANRFYYYPATYSASLTLTDEDGPHIYSVSGYATGDFFEIPLVCIRQNPKSADLKIAFTGDGTFQLLLDKVSVKFLPMS